MGTVVGTVVEECRELFEGQCSDKDHTQQLRLPTSLSGLVPATDEEILEVNESDMYTASDASQTIGYLPAQGSGLLAYPQGRELPSPGWYSLLDLKLRFHKFLMSEEAVQGIAHLHSPTITTDQDPIEND
ncbi:hypothetical protein YC2023_023126 [Brassica napus]